MRTTYILDAPDEEPLAPRSKLGERILHRKAVRGLLGVPLFYKLLLANGLLIALAATAALLLTSFVTGVGGTSAVAVVALFGAGTVFLGAGLNALVIRIALSPLEALERTALRVQQGDYTARAPSSPMADEDLGRLIGLFNHVLDGVEAYRARRQELALRVLQAEERERERVAHELYAGTAQTLAGVLVRMRVAGRLRDTPRILTVMEEVRDEVAQALDEIRAMARQLRPPELDELGVRAALEAHARYLTEGRRIRVRFRGRLSEPCLSADACLALFRIVQEALSNAVVHSGGTEVVVSFVPEERGLTAEVKDDGRGFDPDRTLFSGSGGLGLLGMRERAAYVSGSLSVDSGPGEGTRVRIVIPWSTGGGGLEPAYDDEDEAAFAARVTATERWQPGAGGSTPEPPDTVGATRLQA